MRDLSEKNRSKPQDFSSRASTQKKKVDFETPCSGPAVALQWPCSPSIPTPGVANPSPLHRKHVVLTNWSQSAAPRSIVSWSHFFFFSVFHGFPPEKGTYLEIVWSMFL